MIKLLLLPLLSLLIVPSGSTVYGFLTLNMELEGTGEDRFTIEGMEVNEPLMIKEFTYYATMFQGANMNSKMTQSYDLIPLARQITTYRGIVFFNTDSEKLSFMNNIVGLYITQVNNENGSSLRQIWEWKNSY